MTYATLVAVIAASVYFNGIPTTGLILLAAFLAWAFMESAETRP